METVSPLHRALEQRSPLPWLLVDTPTQLLYPLTVVIQQQLGSREQLGPMLRVCDVQLVEVCFPQLFEVLQCLVAIEKQSGCMLLWAEADYQCGCLQATPA